MEDAWECERGVEDGLGVDDGCWERCGMDGKCERGCGMGGESAGDERDELWMCVGDVGDEWGCGRDGSSEVLGGFLGAGSTLGGR